MRHLQVQFWVVSVQIHQHVYRSSMHCFYLSCFASWCLLIVEGQSLYACNFQVPHKLKLAAPGVLQLYECV